MTLQGLRALIAIVEHGSFSEAALELGTSQSSVSYAIAELEGELGVRLLDRGRFGAAATPVGERVAAHARHLERTLAAIGQEAALDLGELRGDLHVSTFRSVAAHVLAPVMTQLRLSQPGLQVDLIEVSSRCTTPMADLHAGRSDIALTMKFLAEDAVYWQLFLDPYVAVVPETIDLPGQAASLLAIMAHPVILSDGPCAWPIRERLLTMDPTFSPVLESSEDTTMLALAGRGLGIALMPALTIDAVPAGTRIVSLEERIERSIGVALLPGALKMPAVRVLLGSLRAMFPAGEVPELDVAGTVFAIAAS